MSADQGVFRMQPPDLGIGDITSIVSGRTYTCSPTDAIEVPVFDMPGLRAQGWNIIGEVTTLEQFSSGGGGITFPITGDPDITMTAPAGYMSVGVSGGLHISSGAFVSIEGANGIWISGGSNSVYIKAPDIGIIGSQSLRLNSEDGNISLSAATGYIRAQAERYVELVAGTFISLQARSGNVNIEATDGGISIGVQLDAIINARHQYFNAAGNFHVHAAEGMTLTAEGQLIVDSSNDLDLIAQGGVTMQVSKGIYMSAAGTQGINIQSLLNLPADINGVNIPTSAGSGKIFRDPITNILTFAP